jgi:sterol desaturase/sphingolipid hydroxylase (fatty acid hydroxylase superfamily)
MFEAIKTEIVNFFRFQKLADIYQTEGLEGFLNFTGITAILGFLIIIVLLYELLINMIVLKQGWKGFGIPLLIKIVNRVIDNFIRIGMFLLCVKTFKPLAFMQLPISWYGIIYGYIVWEFGHFLYHYWGHKVRLFWCLHGQHHAPEQMNLSVNFAHFFLEGPYATAIRTTTCILLGMSPELLLVIMALDSFWGEIIHLSEHTLPNGRLGILGKYILTPSHHRVHHSRNALYMDTNFCNFLNIWDRVFGTYQEEQMHIKPEYGVTRDYNSNSLWDVYMGEIEALAKDVWHAPGLINKLKYIVMPPGWSHTGEHKLASDMRKKAILELEKV